MKLGLLTDIHVGKYGNSSIIWTWIRDFLIEAHNIFKDEDVQRIYILGDTFDNVNNLDARILNDFKDIVKQYTELFELVFIVGNHDMPYKDSRYKEFTTTFLEDMNNVTVVTEVIKDDLGIVCSPYIVNDKDINKIKKFSKDSDILFGHFAINGFKYTESSIPESKGLGISLFKGYSIVLSGHFHMRQNNKNVTYLGTGIPLKWDEASTEHGIHTFDTETSELKFIDLEHLSMFKKIEIDDVENFSCNDEDFRGKILNVRFKGNVDPDKKKEISNKLGELAFRTKILSDKQVVVKDGVEEEIDLDNIPQVINQWVKKYCPENLDKKTLSKTLEDISKEAEGLRLK